jgi:hypothetical protein
LSRQSSTAVWAQYFAASSRRIGLNLKWRQSQHHTIPSTSRKSVPAAELARTSRSAATECAYRSDWADFSTWCHPPQHLPSSDARARARPRTHRWRGGRVAAELRRLAGFAEGFAGRHALPARERARLLIRRGIRPMPAEITPRVFSGVTPICRAVLSGPGTRYRYLCRLPWLRLGHPQQAGAQRRSRGRMRLHAACASFSLGSFADPSAVE